MLLPLLCDSLRRLNWLCAAAKTMELGRSITQAGLKSPLAAMTGFPIQSLHRWSERCPGTKCLWLFGRQAGTRDRHAIATLAAQGDFHPLVPSRRNKKRKRKQWLQKLFVCFPSINIFRLRKTWGGGVTDAR